MTDVRLTALNPDDSQVYPVACNTSGELLVSKGDEDYVLKSGDTMTGPLDITASQSGPIATIKNNAGSSSSDAGLVVETSITAAKTLQLKNAGLETFSVSGSGMALFGQNPGESLSNVGTSISGSGTITSRVSGTTGEIFRGLLAGDGAAKVRILGNGNATFSGNVTAANINNFRTRLLEAAQASGSHEDLKNAIITALAEL